MPAEKEGTCGEPSFFTLSTEGNAGNPLQRLNQTWDRFNGHSVRSWDRSFSGRSRRAEPPLANVTQKWKEFTSKIQVWVSSQPPPVEVALVTLGSSIQGGFIGGLMGTLSQDENLMPPGGAGAENDALQKMKALGGGPVQQAKNFAVMTGVNAGITTAMKRYRQGKEDVTNSVVAAFGSGVAFSLVSGMGGPLSTQAVGPALSTGIGFAVFQGALFKLGEMFAPKPADDLAYRQAKGMLIALSLDKYEKNFKKGLLTDDTLHLLTDSALQEVRIPPGPRLLILDHVHRRIRHKHGELLPVKKVVRSLAQEQHQPAPSAASSPPVASSGT